MPEIPRLEVPVLHAEARHFGNRPFGGGFVIGRPGNSRAVAVGQHVERMENLRMLHLLAPDSGGGGFIDLVLGEQQAGHGYRGEQLFHIRTG